MIWCVVSNESAHAGWLPNGTPICTANARQSLVAGAKDDAGGAILCWGDSRNGATDVYAQRIDMNGTVHWASNGIPICDAPGNQGAPSITADGSGGAIIAWMDSRSGTSDIYAQRITAGGTAVWSANGLPICTAPNEQVSVSIVADNQGDGAVLVWRDRRDSNWKVYAQRINTAGAAQWALNGVPVSTSSNNHNYFVAGADGNGGAIVAWSEAGGVDGMDIYAQRIDGSGSQLWTTTGVALCLAYENQIVSGLTSDGAGGAIIVWNDDRTTFSGDVYAQRVTADGQPVWTSNGLPIATGILHQGNPAIVSDGVGGATITWDAETYFDGYPDVITQRIAPDGAEMWTAGGVLVGSGPGVQFWPLTVSDGVGGVAIVWRSDYLCGGFHAGRVDAEGDVLWPVEGVPISTIAACHRDPTIVGSGWGGVIVAWVDDRNGINNEDVYAQRVTLEGSIPTAVRRPNAPTPLVVFQNVPNPFTSHTTFEFDLQDPSEVKVDVYDVTGRLVKAASVGTMGRGRHQLAFDGRDAAGNKLPSGVYFYRVSARGSSVSRKILLTR